MLQFDCCYDMSHMLFGDKKDGRFGKLLCKAEQRR